MTPKQSAIRKAYGEHYEACKPNENGWSRVYGAYNKPLLPVGTYLETSIYGRWCYRPIELVGIEDNNGWTRIDGPEDLPKVAGDYRFKRLDNKRNEVAYYIAHPDGDKWFALFYTHWRPVEEVPEPVY